MIDRVVSVLRELVDAPKGYPASRLYGGSARSPHEELAIYRQPRAGCDVVHSLESIVRLRASRVVAVGDAADGGEVVTSG